MGEDGGLGRWVLERGAEPLATVPGGKKVDCDELDEVERRRGSVLARDRVPLVELEGVGSRAVGVSSPSFDCPGGTHVFDRLDELPALLRASSDADPPPKMPFPTLKPRLRFLAGDAPNNAPNSLVSPPPPAAGAVARAELLDKLLDMLELDPKKPVTAPRTPPRSLLVLLAVVGRRPSPPELLEAAPCSIEVGLSGLGGRAMVSTGAVVERVAPD